MITGETPGERTKCQKACQNETQIDPHPLGHCPAEKSTKRKSAAFRRWPSSRQESLRRFSTGVRLKNSPSKASKGSALFPVTGKPSKSCFEFQAEFSQETPMVWTPKRVSGDFSAFPAFSSLRRRLRATRVSPKPPEPRGLGASMVWSRVRGKKGGGPGRIRTSDQTVMSAIFGHIVLYGGATKCTKITLLTICYNFTRITLDHGCIWTCIQIALIMHLQS